MKNQNRHVSSQAAGFGSHRTCLSYLLLTAATIAYLIPAYFVYCYPENITFDRWVFMGVATIFLCILWAFLVMVYSILAFSGARRLAGFFALFCLAWVFLTGFVFPIVNSGAMLTLEQLGTHKKNFIIAAFLATALSVLAMKSRAISWKLPVALSLLAPLILYGLIAWATEDPRNNDREFKKAGTLSPRDNIIVLSFDGIPGNIIADMIDHQDEILAEFKDFTFFKEVIATAPATHASMRSELFGNIHFRPIASTEAQINKKLDCGSLLINHTDDNVLTCGPYCYFTTDKNNMIHINRSVFSSNKCMICIRFLKIALARVSTPIIPLLADRAVSFIAARLNFSFPHYEGPAWKEYFLCDREVLDAIIDNLTTGTQEYSLRYMHFTHTHFPADFDSEGKMRSTSKAWHDQNQNYRGLYEQTRFALRQAARFLGRLKELGIYDRALIVLKSDHGEPVTYFDAPPYNLKINNNPLWGYDRYRPLLMIKNKKARQPAILVDERFVTLGDLAKTLCVARANPRKNCALFPGINLLARDPVGPQDRWVYVDVVRDATSDFRFDSHTTIPVDRDKDFLDSLRQLNLVSD